MPLLWLVVPVHGREGITRLCLEQKAHLLHELAGFGVEAHVLVVGNDGNLGTARELGFATLVRPNVLGLKLNDGLEWACREGGADFVSFVGSDDWTLPAYMAALPAPDKVRASRYQAFVSPDGSRLMVRPQAKPLGGSPWIIPRTALAAVGFRPVAREDRMSGMDFQIAGALGDKRAHFARFILWDDDPLRMVDFKGRGEQIWRWERLQPADRAALPLDTGDVWNTLATRYPPDLVGRMQTFYERGLA